MPSDHQKNPLHMAGNTHYPINISHPLPITKPFFGEKKQELSNFSTKSQHQLPFRNFVISCFILMLFAKIISSQTIIFKGTFNNWVKYTYPNVFKKIPVKFLSLMFFMMHDGDLTISKIEREQFHFETKPAALC